MTGPPRDWLRTIVQFLQRESVVVRVVVAEVRGSAPREPGAFMLVGPADVAGTIGGGRLEWEALAAARTLLEDTTACARVNRLVLGAELGQCCGGVVALWLERFTRDDLSLLIAASDAGARGYAVLSSTIKGAGIERRLVREAGTNQPTDLLLREPRGRAHPQVLRSGIGELTFLERLDSGFPPLWLYGAGHVGQALARILMELPLRLTWIDSRNEQFPTDIPQEVRVLRPPDPVPSVLEAPAGAYFLVMTHSHPTDYALCRAILQRNDFAWLGLIGSQSKAARFRSHLVRDGLGANATARLVSPIGIAGIQSKWPMAIAVGVATQLMQQISAAARLQDTPGENVTVGAPCASEDCSTCGSSTARINKAAAS
jgi:xanthine dehydrogenase accessory factor